MLRQQSNGSLPTTNKFPLLYIALSVCRVRFGEHLFAFRTFSRLLSLFPAKMYRHPFVKFGQTEGTGSCNLDLPPGDLGVDQDHYDVAEINGKSATDHQLDT